MTLTQETTGAAAVLASARDGVLAARAILDEWEVKLGAAQAELARLEQTAGVDLLERPGAEIELAGQVAQLKERTGLIEKAIAAQRPRVLVAESRYLAVEADAHEAAVAEARARLDEHEEKTRLLLNELDRHEGRYVSHANVILSQLSSGDEVVGEVSWKEPKSDVLRRELFNARVQVAVLREMAAGRDPSTLRSDPAWRTPACFSDAHTAEFYPACVKGIEALVPARVFVDSMRRLRSHIAELEQLAVSLPVEIADWELRLQRARAAGEVDENGRLVREFVPGEPSVLNDGRSPDAPGVSPAGLDRRCARLESIEDELIEAKRALAKLTGNVEH